MCSTLRWLGRTTLALLLIVGLPQFAQAAFIDLISQSYMIHASGYDAPPFLPRVTVVDYRETSETPPLSRYDPRVLVGNPMFPDGSFTLFTSADGGITSTSAFVKAEAFRTSVGLAGAGLAEATAAIAFRPLVTDVVVRTENHSTIPDIGFGGWWSGNSGLYDLTTGTAVLSFVSRMTETEPANYNVSLNLEHLYTLYASAQPDGFISGAKLSIAPTGPVSVPESDSTLTFFFVGLGALLLVARSQKFHPSRM